MDKGNALDDNDLRNRDGDDQFWTMQERLLNLLPECNENERKPGKYEYVVMLIVIITL